MTQLPGREHGVSEVPTTGSEMHRNTCDRVSYVLVLNSNGLSCEPTKRGGAYKLRRHCRGVGLVCEHVSTIK